MAKEPLPPQNTEAEENVLGALMLNSAVIEKIEHLSAGDFYYYSHGVIYRTILTLYAEGKPTDPISVIDRMTNDDLKAAGGAERVHEIAMIVPSASNAPHWASIVYERARLRALLTVGNEIRAGALDPQMTAAEQIEQAEELVFRLSESSHERGDWISMEAAVNEAHQQIREAYASDEPMTGLPTGYVLLDDMLSGLQPGNLVILAARPSMGKTALALGIASNTIRDFGRPVGLFTMEMTAAEITQRLLSSTSYVDARAIRNGRLDADQWSRVNDAANFLHKLPLFIDDSTESMVEIRAKARRLKTRQPDLALIVVDYLQLLSQGGDRRYENRVIEISQISRALKLLARELELPILALSQLSRGVEQRHDKRPILSDLRESGAIEQDADVVAFIYRDEYYNPDDTDQQGIAEINIAKHRNGPTGTIKLAFAQRHARFADLLPE